MRITQWGEYATQFCIYIAKHHESQRRPVSATEIAESLGIDQLYAQQILQRLRRGNIIKSIRGAQGGYSLSRSVDEITLKDILTAAEGDTFEPLCTSKPIHEQKCDPNSYCGLRGVWYELREHIDQFLMSRSLRRLVDSETELVALTPRRRVLMQADA